MLGGQLEGATRLDDTAEYHQMLAQLHLSDLSMLRESRLSQDTRQGLAESALAAAQAAVALEATGGQELHCSCESLLLRARAWFAKHLQSAHCNTEQGIPDSAQSALQDLDLALTVHGKRPELLCERGKGNNHVTAVT